MQNSNIKMQNQNEKFKDEFDGRLIRFSLKIIKLCNEIRKDRNLWSIADQLIRCATSIGANIFEAKASSSKRDFMKFFEIALKSANETKYWLIIVRESCPNIKKQVQDAFQEATEFAKIIGAGVLTMKGKR